MKSNTDIHGPQRIDGNHLKKPITVSILAFVVSTWLKHCCVCSANVPNSPFPSCSSTISLVSWWTISLQPAAKVRRATSWCYWCKADPSPESLSLSASNAGNLISHIFRKNDICRDTDWESYFCYKSIEVPDSYGGPRLTFPVTFCGVSKLVEAFKQKQVGTQEYKARSWAGKNETQGFNP